MWLRSAYYARKVFKTLIYSRKEIKQFQKKRIEKIQESAVNMPFYQEYSTNYRNFSNQPVIDKSQLRKNKNYINISTDPCEEISRTTSGTTTNKLEIWFDREADDWLSAIYLRTLYIHGFRPGEKIIQYGQIPSNRSLIGKRIVPIKQIEPNTKLKNQFQYIKNQNPDVLDYFPQMLLSLAKYIKRTDKTGEVELRRIFCRGELLTPSAREYIEKAFGAPVYDQYGTTEFGIIAWECDDGGYHINEDSVSIDVLDSDGNKVGNNETGRIVVTGLVNETTPLIRYDLGDIVEKTTQSCSCNTNFGRIKRIRGRKNDIFKNSKGDKIYPDELTDIISGFEDILFYRFIAKDEEYILKYVPNEKFDKKQIERCAELLRLKLNLDPLYIIEVKELSVSSGGKLRVLENNQSN